MFKDIYKRQKDIFGADNIDTLWSKFSVTLCLAELGQFLQFAFIPEKSENATATPLIHWMQS